MLTIALAWKNASTIRREPVMIEADRFLLLKVRKMWPRSVHLVLWSEHLPESHLTWYTSARYLLSSKLIASSKLIPSLHPFLHPRSRIHHG